VLALSRLTTLAPETSWSIGSVSQKLVRANGSGHCLTEDVSAHPRLSQLTTG
jgi:hypothetical protein